MKYKGTIRLFRGVVLLLSILAFFVTSAGAAEYWLWAGQTNKKIPQMPGGTFVPVWGFCQDANNNLVDGNGIDCTPTVPGPRITVPPGDNTLTIHLGNALPEPVSLNILGQTLTNNTGPVWTSFPGNAVTSTENRAGGDTTSRVRSFSHETAPGGTNNYIWGNFKVGTYLLQSGTNPAKQVQMGLYAPVTKDFAPGQAYEGIPYAREVLALFSEVDPEIHAAIAGGYYGASAGAPPAGKTAITSSVFRQPRLFMINGRVHPEAALNPINPAIAAGETVLIRFLNAGLETKAPQILGTYMNLVAEDGVKRTHQQMLTAFEFGSAQTVDALVPSIAKGNYPLYDAMLHMSNEGQSPGGSLAYLNISADADTVSITSARVNPAGDLVVRATSSAQPAAVLTAEGLGRLKWNGALYVNTFPPPVPASVTVTSNLGGTDTETVPFP